VLANQAVIGVLGRSTEWLDAVVRTPALWEARSSFGMTPLFAACYGAWAAGVLALLEAGVPCDGDVMSEALFLAIQDCRFTPGTAKHTAWLDEIDEITCACWRGRVKSAEPAAEPVAALVAV
jgi:hypothetical protein